METAQQTIDVKAADRLKPFPAVAMKLMNECQKDSPDTARIIELIECDPGLATRVISVANSPLYGCTREICSVPRAVLVLGARPISSFVVSCCIKTVFGDANASPIKQGLLEHCLGTAIVAQILAKETEACDPSVAFLTGMVHDIGKLVFIGECAEQYELKQPDLAVDSVRIEQQLFGVDHVALAFRYLTNLGFPCEITNAVYNHHQLDASQKSLSGVAACANKLAKQWHLGSKSDVEEEPGLTEYFDYEPQARECYESTRCVFLK